MEQYLIQAIRLIRYSEEIFFSVLFSFYIFPGCLARAGQSAYSMTKFALEAFSDCLRQEMLKWGVFVILVEPSYFPGKNLPLVCYIFQLFQMYISRP